jgi:hypothetical protein
MAVDPPEYRYTNSTSRACYYCAHERNVNGWATCAKHGCRTYLNSVCSSFEPLGERDHPEPTREELQRLDGAWMKHPKRE